MAKIRKLALFVVANVLCIAVACAADLDGRSTPCGTATAADRLLATQGLTPVAGGLVYDSNQRLCWLADANPAGNPEVRARVALSPVNADGSTPLVNPDGTMDWETALNFVGALNRFDHGKGWLNHNNWQLPTTIQADSTCSSQKNGSNFGALCTASSLGNLYNVGLARTYPDSVVPRFTDVVWPFFNLQPGLYWTRSPQGDAGYSTFSFNTGDSGANTTRYNFFHVLPVTHDVLGSLPAAPGPVLPYIDGSGAGKAVYDSNTGLSWTLDANLAAGENFDFDASIVLDSTVNTVQFPMTVSMIDADGAMHFSALCAPATAADPCPTPASGWIVAMNERTFGGSSRWKLPTIDELAGLYDDLLAQGSIRSGGTRLEWRGFVGPFRRLQPGFYWACARDPKTDSQAPCDPNLMPGSTDAAPMAYSFNFDDGFLGTDHLSKHFHVMVYFPAPQ